MCTPSAIAPSAYHEYSLQQHGQDVLYEQRSRLCNQRALRLVQSCRQAYRCLSPAAVKGARAQFLKRERRETRNLSFLSSELFLAAAQYRSEFCATDALCSLHQGCDVSAKGSTRIILAVGRHTPPQAPHAPSAPWPFALSPVQHRERIGSLRLWLVGPAAISVASSI